MLKRITKVEGLSPALGPYSFATIHEDTLYTAGQIGQTAEGVLVEGGVEAEAHHAMDNLLKILEATTAGFSDVLKTTIYLTELGDFARVNKIYAGYFPKGEYPVRETVVVTALPLGAHVEISMVAALRRAFQQ